MVGRARGGWRIGGAKLVLWSSIVSSTLAGGSDIPGVSPNMRANFFMILRFVPMTDRRALVRSARAAGGAAAAYATALSRAGACAGWFPCYAALGSLR